MRYPGCKRSSRIRIEAVPGGYSLAVGGSRDDGPLSGADALRHARVRDLKVGEEELMVLSFDIRPRRLPPDLTEAEGEIVSLVMQGLSARAIARTRDTSYRTVAKQLAAIYRKAGVASMAELVAWMLRGAP